MSTHFIWFKINVFFFFYCFFFRPYIILFLSASGFTFPRYYTISIILGAVIFSSSRDRLWSYNIIILYAYMSTCNEICPWTLSYSFFPCSILVFTFRYSIICCIFTILCVLRRLIRHGGILNTGITEFSLKPAQDSRII